MTAAKEVFKPFAEHWHRLPIVDMGILEITEGRRDSHLPNWFLAVCYLQLGGWDVPKIQNKIDQQEKGLSVEQGLC